MKRTNLYLAITLLLLACAAWAGVVYFDFAISGAEAQYQADTQTSQQSSTAQNSSVSTHAVAQDTAAARAQLDTLLTPNVASIANTLRGIGSTTGVTVKLGGALPENTPAVSPGGVTIQALAFSLEADGSFEALMRTEALIETLPLPSSVERFDIQNTSGADAWHMSVSIRVLTTSAISS
jgi:cytoskeletal protein RodZ